MLLNLDAYKTLDQTKVMVLEIVLLKERKGGWLNKKSQVETKIINQVRHVLNTGKRKETETSDKRRNGRARWWCAKQITCVQF